MDCVGVYVACVVCVVTVTWVGYSVEGPCHVPDCALYLIGKFHRRLSYILFLLVLW